VVSRLVIALPITLFPFKTRNFTTHCPCRVKMQTSNPLGRPKKKRGDGGGLCNGAMDNLPIQGR